ncbi:MAG: Nramp family divalent metal transporter [Candidatus Hydrogenedentes bacterium]|nr:Nramp family divalent metal transporter [Candidatus Hydrogenedentota bacterium]
MTNHHEKSNAVAVPPRGWMLLLAIGPGLVWCGEYIGTGEVILSTRSGAIFGVAILWVPVMAIFTKFWIGLAGAHYTVTTGEGMIDMLSRAPGPRNWVIWPVFIGQICSGMISTSAVASAAGAFAHYLIPGVPSAVFAALSALMVIFVVWSGLFGPLKQIMSLLVLAIIAGTVAVAWTTWPGFGAVLGGVFGFHLPQTPAWALDPGASASPWQEIMPLLGWAAGGFASQVWYTYWVIGAGYGMTGGRGYGKPLDEAELAALGEEELKRIGGWRRAVTVDAVSAVILGILVTMAFMIAGAGVLGPKQLKPDGAEVAFQLSNIFSEQWGQVGAFLFIIAGLAAMISTMMGQFAGWPRLLADCTRLLFPVSQRWEWKQQFQAFLLLIGISNMLILFFQGHQPVLLVKTGAVLDGLLLTPIQAAVVGWVLYRVMPRYFREELRHLVRPNPIIGVGLAAAFVLFGFVCVFKLGDYL